MNNSYIQFNQSVSSSAPPQQSSYLNNTHHSAQTPMRQPSVLEHFQTLNAPSHPLSRSDILIVGLNSQGWPVKRRRGKTIHAHNLLERVSPDILVILETAQSRLDVLLTCHDRYQAVCNPVLTDDARHALGHGIAILHRESISVKRVLTQANTDRLLICLVTLSASFQFILVASHVDPSNIKESLALLEHSLRMVQVRYGDSEIVVYTDLNVERGSSNGDKFFNSLPSQQWRVLDPPAATRIGYGNQRDSVIDFFFVNSLIASQSLSLIVQIQQIPFPSDHRPVSLSINLIDPSRKCVVHKSSCLRLDTKKLEFRATELAQTLSSDLLSVQDIQQAVNEVTQQGLPLKQQNNNFWAKFVMNLAKRNPSWSCESNVELMHSDYRLFLLQSFEDLSRGKCAEFYRKVKAATLSSSSTSFLDVNRAYLRGRYAENLEGRLLTSKADVVQEITSWLTKHLGSQRTPQRIVGNMITVTEEEVFVIISRFWGGKAVSVDAVQDSSLSIPVIKSLSLQDIALVGRLNVPEAKAELAQRITQRQRILARNLALLLNSWLSSKQIPNEHVTSRLMLIAKKPIDKEEGNFLDDFRPIAITSVFFKLLEVVVRQRILTLQNQQVIRPLNPVQCGFQPHAGCELNILKLILEGQEAYTQWQSGQARGRPGIVFIDFKSAFDSCDHSLLFRDKLSQARYPTDIKNTIQLLYSQARMTPTYSMDDSVPIKRGVLQGGVLSPDLFNRYIDDLASNLVREGFASYYYADDLAVLVHGKSQAQKLIEIIERWCRINFMALNKAKCGIMFLSGQSQLSAEETQLKHISGVPLVAQYKYLGVFLTKTLQPSSHLSYLSQKIAKFQKMSYILRANKAPGHILQTLWKVFQASTLFYSGFIFLATLSSNHIFQQYRTLHRKTLKYSLGITKNTWEQNIQRHILIPTVEQTLYINLRRVCAAMSGHFGNTLSATTKKRMEELVALADTHVVVASQAQSTSQAKLNCVTANIQMVTGQVIAYPISWLSASGGTGLACVRFSLCCIGFHAEQQCPLCRNKFKGFAHFFQCSNANSDIKQCLSKIGLVLRDVVPVYTPLEILNNPSILSNTTHNPIKLLSALAEQYASLFHHCAQAVKMQSSDRSLEALQINR